MLNKFRTGVNNLIMGIKNFAIMQSLTKKAFYRCQILFQIFAIKSLISVHF